MKCKIYAVKITGCIIVTIYNAAILKILPGASFKDAVSYNNSAKNPIFS